MSNPIFDEIKSDSSSKDKYSYAAGYWYQENKSSKGCNKELINLCEELFYIIENKEEASCVEIRILKDKMERFKL